MTVTDQIDIDAGELARICSNYRVARLALFGSALRHDFRPDSDVDLLVEFRSDARIGLMALERMRRELEQLFGRRVDLVPKGSVKTSLRSAIEDAKVLYAA